MEGLKIKVRHVDGKTEELTVEADQVLIGSGAHCEVRLPIDQARFEHVMVHMTHAGLFAAARAMDPPPTLNGAAFTEAPMLPGAVLRIHQSAIEIAPVELFSEPTAAKQKTKTKSELPGIVVAIAVLAILAVLVFKPKPKDDVEEPQEVPTLFGAAINDCPQKAPLPARSLAESKMSLASTKRERSPFHVEDGVRAVPLYELAAACFRAAGQNEEATEATQAAARLRARASDDFRTRRLRFQYALGAKDWKMAEDEVHTLRAYTSGSESEGGQGKGGEYATWLSNWERKIQLTQGGHKK